MDKNEDQIKGYKQRPRKIHTNSLYLSLSVILITTDPCCSSPDWTHSTLWFQWRHGLCHTLCRNCHSLFLFLFSSLAAAWYMEFLGQGSDLSQPQLQPESQLRRARAFKMHYATPGIKPASWHYRDTANPLHHSRNSDFHFHCLEQSQA